MKNFLLITLLLFFLLTTPLSAQALGPLVPDCAKGSGKEAGKGADFCCALYLVSNFSQLVLGLIGSAALLFFVYGGFLWITSAGRQGQVSKGLNIMANTIIGIIVVVLAWVSVNFIIASFTDQKPTAKVIIQGTGRAWYEVCEKKK